MAQVELKIDTELSDVSSESRSSTARVTAADKVGLLSTISLSQDLIDAFEMEVGQPGSTDREIRVYKKSNIKDGKNTLKTKGNKVIATVGGLIAVDLLADEVWCNYASLCVPGRVPTSLGNCRGGVSLESYRSSSRRDYLDKAWPSRRPYLFIDQQQLTAFSYC